MNHKHNFNLVDPFEEQSILALNPRTFGVSKDALKSKDLEAIHQYMKSMVLQSPNKHLEEAMSVVDGGSKLLKTRESVANIKEKENIQEQRPGLDRKRARFSLMPDSSQSSKILEPSLEINHLQDPEEFFAAFEKFENTQKELKRQRGGEEVDEVKASTTARHPRPEAPRRKASYKHHDYSSQSQDVTSVAQETLQDNIGSQPTQSSQQESFTPDHQDNEEEVARSIAKSENKVNKLFDELMASHIDTLDENQALDFLKDRMKIKPVDLNDLKLPEFLEVPRVDFIPPVKSLLKDSQTTLSDTHDVTKGKTLQTPRRLFENPFPSLGSPTPPKSPFLAISSFGKYISKSISRVDPFSTNEVDLSPPRTSTRFISGGTSHHSKEFPVSATLDSSPKNKITETALADVEDRDVDDNVTDNRTNEEINGNAEDIVQEAASVTEVNINVEDIIEENVENVREKEGLTSLPEVNAEVFETKDLSQPEQTDAKSIEDLDTSEPAQNLNIEPEQQKEEHPRTKTIQRKKITRKVDLKKKRQSLAGAGSCWTSGVRRSSRIKRRPLEYWKGERLLYGRVHNSLPTVIGVKYISPSKAGFKVESFVSDKYKDLVELTARH